MIIHYQELTNPFFSWLIIPNRHPRWILEILNIAFCFGVRQAADEQDPDLDRLLEALLEVGGPTADGFRL